MKKRRKYSADFKREAVALVEQHGNLSSVSRELGINPDQLRRWKKQLQQDAEQAFPGNGNPRDAELAELQRRVRRVEEENAILKKAAGFFSIDPH